MQKKQSRNMDAMTGKHLCVLVASCFLFAGSHSFAHDIFGLTGGYVGNIDSRGNVDFSLTFNQKPDFSTVDQYGRQANGFQFCIATGTNVPRDFSSRPYASLIRGNEIWVANEIRIRNDGLPDPDPDSGGWGSIRGSVSYNLRGRTLTFSVPASMLNISGPFAYNLLLTTYGVGDPPVYTGLSGGPICVPEPSPYLLNMGILGVLYARGVRRRSPLSAGGGA